MLQGGRRACRAPQAALPGGTERPAASEATLGVCARAQATREELGRRRAFEDAIKRPYFHVKPLDGAQLAAWGRYLDYAEPRLADAPMRRLFERCLVACACYVGAPLPTAASAASAAAHPVRCFFRAAAAQSATPGRTSRHACDRCTATGLRARPGAASRTYALHCCRRARAAQHPLLPW